MFISLQQNNIIKEIFEGVAYQSSMLKIILLIKLDNKIILELFSSRNKGDPHKLVNYL